MSGYVKKSGGWQNDAAGNTKLNKDALNDFDARIDAFGDDLEGVDAGLAADIGDHETRVAQLESDMPRVPPSPNSPAADTYTLQTSDMGLELATLINGNAKAWTLPNFGTGVGVGTCCYIDNNGTGSLSLVIPSGVTVRSRLGILTNGTFLISSIQWSVMRLRKEASVIWRLSGELG